jgi:6-phosphogluconolactonase
MTKIVSNSEDQYVANICQSLFFRYEKAVKEKGFFTLVLSGGNTPVLVYKALVENYLDKINWKLVHFFWTDERWVSKDHGDNNYQVAWENLLKYVDYGSSNEFDTNLGIEACVKAFRAKYNEFAGMSHESTKVFDFVLLGMGEDGHVASIFSKDEIENTDICFHTDYSVKGYRRVSLTVNAINSARYVTLLVSNSKKMNLLNDKQKFPVGLIQVDCLFILDSAIV